MITKSDLETVDYYFVSCIDCGIATENRADWPDAIADATADGFEVIDGATYCSECAEHAKHEDCEDHPCEDCHGTAIDRAMDAYELQMDHENGL